MMEPATETLSVTSMYKSKCQRPVGRRLLLCEDRLSCNTLCQNKLTLSEGVFTVC
jgi:hypothetical protein